jgi:hypothetical protein
MDMATTPQVFKAGMPEAGWNVHSKQQQQQANKPPLHKSRYH